MTAATEETVSAAPAANDSDALVGTEDSSAATETAPRKRRVRADTPGLSTPHLELPPGYTYVILPPNHTIIDKDILTNLFESRSSSPVDPATPEPVYLRIRKKTILGDINCPLIPDENGDRPIEWIPNTLLKVNGRKYDQHDSFLILLNHQTPGHVTYDRNPENHYFEILNPEVYHRYMTTRGRRGARPSSSTPTSGSRSAPVVNHHPASDVVGDEMEFHHPTDRKAAIREALLSDRTNYKSTMPKVSNDGRVESVGELTQGLKQRRETGVIDLNQEGVHKVTMINPAYSAKDTEVHDPSHRATKSRFPLTFES